MILIIFIVFIPFESFTTEKFFVCKITEELENNKPAKKNLFTEKKIRLFLNNNWLFETKEKEWKLLNPEKYDLISKYFREDKGMFTFVKKIYNTRNKKDLELINKIILKKKTKRMTFLKEYYNNNEKFFSSEIRGFCK